MGTIFRTNPATSHFIPWPSGGGHAPIWNHILEHDFTAEEAPLCPVCERMSMTEANTSLVEAGLQQRPGSELSWGRGKENEHAPWAQGSGQERHSEAK